MHEIERGPILALAVILAAVAAFVLIVVASKPGDFLYAIEAALGPRALIQAAVFASVGFGVVLIVAPIILRKRAWPIWLLAPVGLGPAAWFVQQVLRHP
ncbi:hypothetical protein [Methylopila sp. Yamaguchi]|uniref:hypothetical protein n=1 Tax=Methylopila sp. Yamaguchi TaxID=1437817 RepID=UPI000CBADD95|nr:hypothetical protein [Methylopila sp. Yamaguchi]GBD48140.1 hypothetical protein METY_1353 [Methylopila sp. Yamaguchi]